MKDLAREVEKLVDDIVTKRAEINILSEAKLNIRLFNENERASTDIRKECNDEDSFNNRIQALNILIEGININEIRKILSTEVQEIGSINYLEILLKERVQNFNEQIIKNLRLLRDLRSKKYPIHRGDRKFIQALHELGFPQYPPNWNEVWKVALKKYMESLDLLIDNLNTLPSSGTKEKKIISIENRLPKDRRIRLKSTTKKIRKEVREWEKLQNKVREIFELSKFDVWDDKKTRQFKIKYKTPDIDVIAEDKKRNTKILIQCKKYNFRAIPIRPIAKNFYNAIKRLKNEYKNIGELKVIFVFHDVKLPDKMINEIKEEYGIPTWTKDITRYYEKISKVLGEYSKFQILFEVGVKPTEIDKPICVPCIEVKQPIGKFYIFVIPPRDILKIAYVFRHSSEIPRAYQRILKLDRIKSMRKFLSKRWAYLPNNIIVNFHEKVYFKKILHCRGVAIGKLIIPMKFCSAWVIDGQHRLYGFTKTQYVSKKYKNFDLIVVGFRKLTIDKQTTMFVNINREQKKIASNLLYSLILNLKPKIRREIPTKDNIKRALELTQEIAKTKYWKGKIAFKETQGDRPITITMFATYKLADLLKEKGAIYRYSISRNTQLSLLKKYFSVIAAIYGDKWDGREYALTTQIGVNTFLILLEKILEFCEKKNDYSLLTRGKLLAYLSPLPQIVSFKKDECGQFTSGVGWRILANKIIKKLNKINPTIKLSLVRKKTRK